MLQRLLNISNDNMPEFLDATDALAAAMCHYYESLKPAHKRASSSWKDFIAKNPDKVKK
jgi:crossover junction endodeoxyribonuclease RuvC